MAISWLKRLKIRIKHARVGQPEKRKLRIDFEEMMESSWPDAPMRNVKTVRTLRREQPTQANIIRPTED